MENTDRKNNNMLPLKRFFHALIKIVYSSCTSSVYGYNIFYFSIVVIILIESEI